jgi:hypothetical protein
VIKKERAQVINPENIKAMKTLIKKNRKKMSFKLKIILFIILKLTIGKVKSWSSFKKIKIKNIL